VPIKLGNHAIGCFEVANKKANQEFTTNDFLIVQQVCDEIASGLISHEMKYNIKKEFEDEVKYFKGLVNSSYNSFLIPLASDLSSMIARVLKAEKVLLFLQHKEIEHLYSLNLHSSSEE
jgi:GAF domain-containing protein